jgi:hypothetical protein
VKHIILTLMLITLCTAGAGAAIIYETSSDYIDIHITSATEISTENGVHYLNLAFPAKNVSLELINSQVNLYDSSGNFLSTESNADTGRFSLENTIVMRDLIMHRIKIELVDNHTEYTSRLTNAVIRLQAEGEIRQFNAISSVFAPIYKKLADNYHTSYLRNLQEMPAKMLIVSHEELTNLSYFTDWKNECGIDTEVVFRSDLGTTVGQIKNYIQEVYDSQEHPPDYLLLIGDVNGSFIVPSYYHSDANNVTDHPYTLLEGNDYFPEMIVGRFSIEQADDLNTIISKVLSYEKTPSMTNPEWFDNMVIVAGNYSDTQPIPTTPVTTSMWLAEKAADYGYDNITEIYYWPPEYPTYPGTSEIRNAINAGAGIVTYRGWGNAWGWNFPYFHTENILQLTNGLYLPVMTSIVCNTGDFANQHVDPCFGELWLTAGSPGSPKGGVAFVGPSDLHTKTNFNNSIFSGFYQGLLDERIHTFGTAVLRGKIELYENFPLNHAFGDDVEFYFYVYNLLGDPSLSVWTKTPQLMTSNLPQEISLGQNYLDIHVPEIGHGMVTAKKDDEFLVAEFLRDHSATLYFDALSPGTITVTVTAVNRLPLITSVDVVEIAIDPVITEIVPSGEILAGDNITLNITLANQGTQAAPFYATASELTGMADIQNPEIDFGNLAPGASATLPLDIAISPECPDNYELSFALNFADLDHTIKFPLLVSNIVLEPLSVTVNDANGVLDPGDTADITIDIANLGNITAYGVTATITSATTALTVNNDFSNVGDLIPGASSAAAFNVSADPSGFNGRDAGIYLHLEDDAGRIYETSFIITIGVVTNTDPTGPCLGGYYAYDSFDTDYDEAPLYFWHEIDPELGGNGNVILMTDDQAESIALPFDFTFYNAVYDSITVSSNGWISFVTTWQNFFTNWNIPSALGPYAQVAGYWDDLLGPDGGEELLRLCYYYDSQEDYFVIEWSNAVNREDNLSPEIFQIILYDPAVHQTESGNGIIQINYKEVNNPDVDGNYCTIGLENEHQEFGLLYTYANFYPASASPLEDNLAIKFTTEPPDDLTENYSSDLTPQYPQLHNNYPNPFNPETNFSFAISEPDYAQLTVYNIKGEKVKTIMGGYLESGDYNYIWYGDDDRGRQVSSGIYFYELKSSRFTTTKKCVLMK